MQRHLRWVPLALAAMAVMPLSGCLKLHARFVAQPDLSFAGTILIGMDARLMESMGPDAAPFAGLKSGSIGESWSVREFEKDGWRYAEATGVGPASGTAGADDYYYEIRGTLKYINEEAGRHFDPRIVELFNKLVQ